MSRFVYPVPLLLAAVLVAFSPLHAQPRAPRKVAFVVGVNAYDHDFPNLKFAERDAEELAKALKAGGFEVVVLTGSATGANRATRKNIETRLQKLLDGDGDDAKKIKKGDLVLVALSGHGQQIEVTRNGRTFDDAFFCPADGKPMKPETLVSISHLVDDMLAPCGGRNLLLIDACRDLADANRARGVEGRDMSLKGETAVLFSCARGEKSYEIAELQQGLFTHAVLKGLKAATTTGGVVTWGSLTSYVEEEMAGEALRKHIPGGATQTPIPTRGQLPRTVLLAAAPPPGGGSSGETAKLGPNEREEDFEYVVNDTEKKRGKRRVLTLDLGGGVKMEFVYIKAGTFTMGTDNETTTYAGEGPKRTVKISRAFYLGKYEVTQAQYKAVEGSFPEAPVFAGDDLPAAHVSWEDARRFCETASKATKKTLTLPTEAEWEYACRAGTTTPFHFGSVLNGYQANHDGNNPFGTTTKGQYHGKPVSGGTYSANPWGLYDMHGNVFEWCLDYHGPYENVTDTTDPIQANRQGEDIRVARGGGWTWHGDQCRSAFRSYFEKPTTRTSWIGFRVLLRVN